MTIRGWAKRLSLTTRQPASIGAVGIDYSSTDAPIHFTLFKQVAAIDETRQKLQVDMSIREAEDLAAALLRHVLTARKHALEIETNKTLAR